MKKINIKLTSIRFLFIILGIAAGLLFMAQLRTIPDRITNPATPVLSLRETRDLLYAEQTDISSEAVRLRSQNNQLQSQIKSKNLNSSNLDLLETQKMIAGLTKVAGEGLKIEFNDSNTAEASEETIVHAADLRDIINLLWSSGAEAVSINDQRIVFTTDVDCVVNTILINNTKISSPFVIKSIGNNDRFRAALESPLNLSDIKQRIKSDGLIFNTSYEHVISIEPFNGTFILSTENR